jgi:hypothetical protein
MILGFVDSGLYIFPIPARELFPLQAYFLIGFISFDGPIMNYFHDRLHPDLSLSTCF